MDLSTDSDFLSGALQLVTGEKIVPRGKDGGAAAGSFDLDCLHKRSLQWRGEEIIPAPTPTAAVPACTEDEEGDRDQSLKMF